MKLTPTRSYQQKKEAVTRDWHVIDMKDKVLGRTAAQIAILLMGKQKPTFTNNVDGGDYVVVINAKQVAVTGNKRVGKIYFRHSQFPGGLKTETFEHKLARHPVQLIEEAVWGMLPKNKLRDPRMKRLKVFPDGEHTYTQHIATK
jgi:large subunit ribosomal protein L13